MSFVKVSDILELAVKNNTSVMAFNAIDYNMAYSVVKAAEEVNKPVIIMLYPEHSYGMNAANLGEFTGMVKDLAEQVSVSVGLHLDHCNDFEYIVKAIRSGFTSVMFDGSMLSVEENIRLTKKVVEVAKIFGVDVEAELGHVGFADNEKDQDDLDLYTKPEVAKAFCEQTAVTSVAIAIGSAHGVYTKTPKLDIDRLKEINVATDTPLVLHGGSGIPNDQLEIAFKCGINKFNVGTEFFQLYYDSLRKYCEEYKDKGSIFDVPKYCQEILIKYLKSKLELSKF